MTKSRTIIVSTQNKTKNKFHPHRVKLLVMGDRQ